MKVFRSDQVDQLSTVLPDPEVGLNVNWLEGPTNGEPLDVGLVTLTAGGRAPAHSHLGGQLIVVLSGHGFVETADERVSIGPGDLVITPPGELHTHGALADGPMAHLTVTTGGYEFPDISALPNSDSNSGAQ